MSHRGESVTNASLRGSPFIANFIFASCVTVCPLLTAKMVQAQRALPAGIRFVSFSVDPAHDTPAVLADYARQWAPDEPRWSLLVTDSRSLPSLMAGFHVPAASSSEGGGTIVHTAIFVLADADGVVRGLYDLERPNGLESLVRDARALAGNASTSVVPPSGKPGAALFHDLGCAACHENPSLAPSLRGLLGKQREFEVGASVIADRDYLRESILRPESKRVRGFPLKMPSYDGQIAEVDLEALVDWLATLREPASGETATVEIDPVCGMAVRAGPGSPSFAHSGHTYFFCSAACRDRFTTSPNQFLRSPAR